jgi:hypothetical protein
LVVEGRDVTVRQAGGAVEFWRCGITVRNAEDVRIEGLTFRQTPNTAVCVLGPARRVTIENCTFAACGVEGGSVTIWLGAGTHDCVVRGCRLDTLGLVCARGRQPSHAHMIGIMTDEQDCTGHRIEDNTISHYSYGIQCGTSGTCRTEGRHQVRGNRILCPGTDGIHIKSARCVVEENTIIGSRAWAISARAGYGSVFRGNRIEDSYVGLMIRGDGHTITDNTFVRVRAVPIRLLAAKPNGDGFAATNTHLAGNVFTDCGGADTGEPTITWAPLAGPPLHVTGPIADESGATAT